MSFLYINVLFFMLIPSFVLLFLIIKKGDKFSLYFDKNILNKLSVSNRYFSNKVRNIILLLSLIFMIIALARPVINEKNYSLKQNINSVILAIDISKSMLANDIMPNRLIFAKKKAIDLINEYNNFAIGVIVFAKNAFILSPLTQDLESLKYLVNNLDYTLDFNNGTNLYATLEASNKLLKNYENKNLILLTDGADKIDFSEEISYAKDNNIKVFTIATATTKPTPIKLKNNTYLVNENNQVVTVKLNENIKNLSLQSNGGYINFTLNNNDIKQIKNEITKSFSKKDFKSKNIKTYTELFYYPLGLSIFLLLIAFSSFPSLKKNSKPINSFFIIVLFSFIYPNTLKAEIFDFLHIKEATKAYQNKKYDEAYNEFIKIKNTNEKEYNIANTLYKQAKYKEAIKRYKNIKSENRDFEFNRLHNIGNSYVKNKQYEEAIKSYEDALKIKSDKKTKENLEAVKNFLKNKNKQEKEEKKKNKNTKNKDKNNQEKEQKKNKEENTKNKQEKTKIDDKKFISKKEEDKWLKQIEDKKPKVFLQKVKSKKNVDSQTAW